MVADRAVDPRRSCIGCFDSPGIPVLRRLRAAMLIEVAWSALGVEDPAGRDL
jgi:hypothetical protein